MQRLLRLQKYSLHAPDAALRRVAAEHGLSNIFNPSLVIGPSGWHVSFRAQGTAAERPFRAFLASGSTHNFGQLIDLTEHATGFGLTSVADPKLVTLGGELYVTFNSGYSARTHNGLFLMAVTPQLGYPQRCELGDRQRVEKNWAFYLDPEGELRVLYSAVPPISLRLIRGELRGAGALHFARLDAHGTAAGPPHMSIGTQMCFTAPDEALLIVHQKIEILRKRAYLGALATVRFDGERTHTAVSSRRMAHSLGALLPPRHRHNRGLFSATYFSGVTRNQSRLILGYGVNDRDFGFASIDADLAWR